MVRLRIDASVWFKTADCFMDIILAEEEFKKPFFFTDSTALVGPGP
jgi:hypothetical protein